MWVITSYYNPAHYASRRRNYFEFRRNLKAPLITVEIASDRDEFELSECDADILVQGRSRHSLWQKERLLKVGRRPLKQTMRD